MSEPGGGLGWLAVPVPILGLIGLIGMVFIMGRRGWAEALGYTGICIFAIVSTILPFCYAEDNVVFDFTPQALLHTPFPGFESVLIGPNPGDVWLLIFGLLLSAATPWVLTGLFLRPKRSMPPPDRREIAQ